MSEPVRIAHISELPAEGEVKEFDLAGRTICVANIDGQYHAMDNVCPHRGGFLGQGSVGHGYVICPWHGWQFDPESGRAVQNRTCKVDVYSLFIQDEQVLVQAKGVEAEIETS